MFLLSKLGWLLVQPLSLALILSLCAIVAGLAGLRRLQTATIALGALLLVLTLSTNLGTVLLQRLEQRIPRVPITASPVCIIVLGGGFEGDVTKARGGVELNQAGERYLEMLRLARLYPTARFIVSGGDGSLTGGYEDDYTIVMRLAADFGLPEQRFIAESRSRNTFENAVNSRAIMEREGFDSCVMITSAFHMPRAMGMMRKAGARVLPWPVDYRTTGHVTFGVSLSEPMSNAQNSATAIREWLGLLANSLVGRTDAFFPSP